IEATRLQEDLKRAQIDPKWWVINQSLYGTDTEDPVLKGRAVAEKQWIKKVKEELSDRCALVPWMEEEKIGYHNLKEMINAKLPVNGIGRNGISTPIKFKNKRRNFE